VKSTGSSATFTCRAVGFPQPDIQWYFTDNSGQRNKLSPSIDIDTVVIDNLNFTHDGKYECEAFNGIGEKQKRTIQLKVEALKRPILENVADVLIVPKIDEIRTLVCECNHCLPMRSHAWTFNGIPIGATNLGNVRVNYSSSNTDRFQTTLTLDHVVQDNEGVYKCELANDLNSASHEIVVNILRKPKIQRITASNSKTGKDGAFILDEQKSTALECQLAVELDPSFNWFKDEVHISSDRFLKLNVLTYKDTGLYRCEVRNSEGTDTKSIQVQVHGYPRIVSEFPKNLMKITGKKLKVECKAIGFPLPKVRWDNEEGYDLETTNGMLILDDYILEYSKRFVCHAENSLGATNRAMIMKYQENRVVANKRIQLLCPFPAEEHDADWYKVINDSTVT
jgi:predicted hotdog family 3-hydroxylacyl-ACP dehydratase